MRTEIKAKAYLPNYISIDSVIKGQSLPQIAEVDNGSYFEKEGYPLIGDVTVIIEFHSKDKIVQSQLDSLNTQLAAVRALNQCRENVILDKISKLQAIEFTPD